MDLAKKKRKSDHTCPLSLSFGWIIYSFIRIKDNEYKTKYPSSDDDALGKRNPNQSAKKSPIVSIYKESRERIRQTIIGHHPKIKWEENQSPKEAKRSESDMAVTKGRYCFREVLPFAAMVLVECANTGNSTLFKAASDQGMSYMVFVVYSFGISAIALIPLAFIFHRFVV